MKAGRTQILTVRLFCRFIYSKQAGS